MEAFKFLLMISGAATLALISYFLFDELIDFIKDWIRKFKRSYDIKHRFEKQPLAKCHCIDCYFCAGYIYLGDKESKEVKCNLWDGITVSDDSFCYKANTGKRW